MKIIEIEKGSIGSKIGLKAGDMLQTINHRPVRDFIDYRYNMSDESLLLQMRRDGKSFEVHVEKDADEDIGLHLEPIQFKSCGNNCIFCFIDQLPAGLRPSLYFKDEDYRLSFLHGAYITLTGIAKDELDRIRKQRLSPLYVSVHTTDPDLRRKMMRSKDAGELMERIEYLAQAHIELHTQVVLCPGINDGPHLERTIKDLSTYHPHVRSVALVPVGLTRHRHGLSSLAGVGPAYAKKLIQNLQPWQENFRRMLGETFLCVADEFYLLAGIDIPPRTWYDDFPQIENGVGMVRQFLDAFSQRKSELPAKADTPLEITVVTGTLANTFLRRLVPTALGIGKVRIEIVPVKNRFFGESVTVSGLLTGEDIVTTLRDRDGGEVVMLPPNCINEDGFLLDDSTIEDIAGETEQRVVVGTYDLVASLLALASGIES